MSTHNNYPFKPAKLGDRKGNLSKPWYIQYSAWDAQQKKLRRKFDYEINQYKTPKERYAFAKVRINQINELLTKGYHFDARKVKQQEKKREQPLLRDAYLWVLKSKKPELSQPTYNSYSSTINVFNEWLSGTRWRNISVTRLTTEICYKFIDELADFGISPRTINGRYITYLRSFHNYYRKRNKGIKQNPWLDVDKKKEVLSSMHIPFLDSEKKQLKNLISKVDKELWMFIQFIYYCYLRPNEVRQLQKYNIMLERGMIFIDAPKAKNKKTLM
jgi:integrase